MLTKEDFRLNFRIISISCKLGIVPLKVDIETGKLHGRWIQSLRKERATLFCHVCPSCGLDGVAIAVLAADWCKRATHVPPLAFHVFSSISKFCILDVHSSVFLAQRYHNLLQQVI